MERRSFFGALVAMLALPSWQRAETPPVVATSANEPQYRLIAELECEEAARPFALTGTDGCAISGTVPARGAVRKVLIYRSAPVVILALALAGCNGISYPSSPAINTPVTPAAVVAIFLTAEHPELPAGGGTTKITIASAASTSGSPAAPNASIDLTATSGALSTQQVTTGLTGHATVLWSGDQTGEIVARSGDVTGRLTVKVNTPPTNNPPGGGGGNGGGSGGGNPGNVTLGISLTSTTNTYVNEPTHFEAKLLDTIPSDRIAWDFTADGIEDARGRNVSWTFTTAGDALVGAKATLDDGTIIHANGIRFPVRHRPPDASASLTASDNTVRVGTTVRFDATVTGLASDESVVSFEWDFGTGPAFTTTSATQTHTHTTAGTKTARVTIRTTYGRGIVATTTVTVLN